jgi:hypothetical protein
MAAGVTKRLSWTCLRLGSNLDAPEVKGAIVAQHHGEGSWKIFDLSWNVDLNRLENEINAFLATLPSNALSPVCSENSVLIDYVTESPNVNGDDRAPLVLPDAVRIAVEEPT